MKKTFILPDFQLLSNNNNKVVIVSIIGKNPAGTSGLKVWSLGQGFGGTFNTSDELSIEGSYDEENQIIYLHVTSLLDSDVLIKKYDRLLEICKNERNCDDFLSVNDEIKSSFARALLFLIHCSHIVIISQPGTTMDTSYVQYFKAVDNLSQKLFVKITDSLATIENLSREWIENGRFCTPRFIFYFERCPKGVQNIKKMEHNMEDRIYRILKKTRIISNFGSSLFAIPMNEEFVFISSDGPIDLLGDAVRGLIQDCQPGGVMQIESPFCSQSYSRNFFKFLQVHIKQAKYKGFNDSSRHQQPVHFELPTLKQWIESTNILYNIIIIKKDLINLLCTDTRFSEQRCLKVLPLAIARYQEGLPSHYGRCEHERRLLNALALFSAQARGSVFEQYVLKLKQDCKNYWENGRQQCEALSMTGNPCKLPKHISEQEEHKSGFIYKSVCDCGRKIGPREDPYNIKQANYLFYQMISKDCVCSKLERINFPIFQSSSSKATILESKDQTPDTNEKGLINKHQQSLNNDEYLPEMLTLTSSPGLLPIFSSWSLVCLGPSSLYSHNLGLSESHHPGFISSTNYLLPWDVTVYSKSNWTQNKYSSRGRRGRSTVGSLPQFSVKVFIGVEYECTLGHRFMLAAPDKMLKATPGSIVKDTGHKIAESDMPLYYPCVCRANKLAQLMRLHVVTPKAPVYCTLDPKIQAAPNSPIFISTLEAPKLTQSAYWVMRLPYVYMCDKTHYTQNLGARLLQGVFGVVEIE